MAKDPYEDVIALKVVFDNCVQVWAEKIYMDDDYALVLTKDNLFFKVPWWHIIDDFKLGD